ncbi:MAG TPA: FAD-dependent oxidoreductase [Candidatus Acidoferrum sp.]|nr:FAD-dependent oxidoreductase [Candidatus Acidoferrum sp.]
MCSGATLVKLQCVTGRIDTRCCIAGGGPAGIMLGFLLARAGVDVYVLEKHNDFLRDFRGDTIHSSTLELMHELGLLEEFLKIPHQKVLELAGQVGGESVTLADFTHLPTRCKFLAFMPQWDFLNFIAEKGKAFSRFHLKMNAEVIDIVEENGLITGVRAKTRDGEIEIRADLIVGADGRRSTLRERAELQVINLGAPMDVMWLRLSKLPGDPRQTFGHVEAGKIFVMLDREQYWQCAYVIPKGSAGEVRERGLAAFRQEIAQLSPFLGERVEELRDWKDISLLTVAVDRLSEWSRPGLLCIGDAAHAMSPIGGVGINLAIQDAVAAANILAPIFMEGRPSEAELSEVQRRREFPTRATQRMQTIVQNHVLARVLSSDQPISLPWPLKLFQRWPFLRRIPARIIGVGFRPEHIKTSAVGEA